MSSSPNNALQATAKAVLDHAAEFKRYALLGVSKFAIHS